MPVQATGAPYAWTAGSSTAGTLYPSWTPPVLVVPPSRIVAAPAVNLWQSFDGGTGAAAGSTLSAANTDGPGSTPLTQVSVGASATAVFDSTASDGALGAQFTTPATATTAYAGWTTAWATQTTTMMWADVRLEAAPGANLRIFGTLVDAATLGAIVVITPTRQIVIANSAGTTVYTSATNVVPLGQHFRLEFAVTHDTAAGTAQVKLYNATSSAVADLDSGLLTGLNTGAQSTILRYGIGQSGANLSVRLDRLGGSNTIVWGQGAGGASSVTADASLAVTATLSAGAAATLPASAGLAVTASLTADATRTAQSDAALAVTATLSSAGALTAAGAAALAVTATLTAAGTQTPGTTPVTYVAATSGDSVAGTTTSFVTTLPTGWAAGDVALLFGHVSATNLTMATPAGWTLVPGPTWPVNEGTSSRTYAWYRVLQSGDTAPTITNSGAVTGGWEMLAYRSASATTPIGQVGTSTASATSIALPSLTGVAAGSMLAADVHARVATGTIPTGVSPDAAYTEDVDHVTSRATSNANMAMEAAHRSISTAGSYGGETFATTNTVTSSMVAALVEVMGASTGPVAQNASASLAVTATLTTAAALTATSAAALPVTASLSAGATVTRPAGAALAVTATLTAAGQRTASGGASLAVTATLTAAGTAQLRTTAALAVTVTLTAGGTNLRQAGAALAVVATLLADAVALGGVIYRPDTGTTSRPGTGTTARPNTGITARTVGVTVRPFTSTTARP